MPERPNRPPSLRRAAAVLACLAAAAAIVPVKPVRAENVVRWSSQGDAITLDPHGENEGLTLAIQSQIYEPLIERDPALALEPMLATSWRPVEPAVWEFEIRQGVTFHDGRPFTVDDVVFSFERAMNDVSDMRTILESIDRIEAKDETRVHIFTNGPNPILPQQITDIYMMSRGWAEEHGVETPQDRAAQEETYAVRHANGTGAFMLEIREPDVKTVTVKNDAWWGLADPEKNAPHNIDRIVYTPIANSATRVAALLSGELDFILDTPLQDLRRIERTPGLTIKSVPQVRTIFLGLNMGARELASSNVKGRNPFADPRVREAMQRSIDAAAIQKKVMRGKSAPAGTINPPGVHGYSAALDERLPYDPDLARKLMNDAGYEQGFDVRLDCPNDRYINDEAICQAVVPMLAKIGIRVALNSQPKSLHFPLIQNARTDFYLLGWSSGTLDSHYTFSFLASDNRWNQTGFRDERLQQLIDGMAFETDIIKRDAMIAEAWTILKRANTYLPLHHQVLVWTMRDALDLPIQADNVPQFRYARLN